MSIIRFSKMPAFERSPTGMLSPHCSMYCSSPTVLRHTDLPPALGPDMMSMRFWGVRMMSSGTTCLSCFSNDRRSRGCEAPIQSMYGRGCSCGSMALMSLANSALARTKSILASMP